MNGTLAICTLFEGGYHYGVGALANSLHANGFRGVIWAGYRGALPPWAKTLSSSQGYAEFQVAEGCVIRFLPVQTTAHFTNFKPDFMLSLFEEHAPDCQALFYLDPDVVVCEAWRFFEEWISCGVTVCEDVNSPFAPQHPRRIGWRRFYGGFGIQLAPKEAYYANGGFVGVRREDIAFLKLWKRLQDHMMTAIGGAEYAGISGGKSLEGRRGFAHCFDQPDQEALNATFEAVEGVTVSFVGRQAMGFEAGKPILPHALGSGKPWQKHYVHDALCGKAPRAVDKQYWHYAQGPIPLYAASHLRSKRLALRVAAAMGRFIRRN